MFKTKKQIKVLAFLSLATFFVLAGFGCKQNVINPNEVQPITLNYWRLWDGKEVFDPMIVAFQQANPNIHIVYKKLTFEEYENAVTEALASGKGPDIWSIHNDWLPKEMSKLSPAPDAIMPLQAYQEAFVDVASQEFVVDDKIYGVPLSVDTLAIYYNKDLLNTAGITTAPATWEDFKEDIKKLTKIDIYNNITQSGSAIGTGKNINRAVDILYLLMLQNGTQMTDLKNTHATFNQMDPNEKDYFPGQAAMTFYTDFANPKKEIYTWNLSMPYSLDAFIGEQTAMTFNYSYQRSYLKLKSPNLNYDIAPAPQIQGAQKSVNFPNYWAEVVSANSQNKDAAWKFLAFISNKDNVAAYCQKTDRPASRKDVLETQLDDPTLKVFAKQALSAKSWYQAKPEQIESLFITSIDDVVTKKQTVDEAINSLNEQVSNLMKP